MSVSAFKKKDVPPESPIPKGTVVYLNSDIEDNVPMTTSEFKNGQVLCRWHDDPGCLQGDWFYPEELHLGDDVGEIVFTPEVNE
jgi:hypothetical protein